MLCCHGDFINSGASKDKNIRSLTVFTQGHHVSIQSVICVAITEKYLDVLFLFFFFFFSFKKKHGSVCNRVGIHSSFREITSFQTRRHSAQTGVLGVSALQPCDGNTSGPSLAIESLPHPLSSTLPVIHLCSIQSGPSPITPHSHQQLPRPRLISRPHALKLVREELNFPPGQPGSLVTTGRQQCLIYSCGVPTCASWPVDPLCWWCQGAMGIPK